MSVVYNCPSCGAPVALKYRFSKMAVCGSCKQTSVVEGETLVSANVKSELANYGSKFAVGATGTHQGKNFELIGRARFEYEGGFWDEWLMRFENNETEYWLHEDEGDLILYTKTSFSGKLPDFKPIEVGKNYNFAEMNIFTTEKHEAKTLGGEGELPFLILPNQKADFIDGIIYGTGQLFSFDFLSNETLFFIGQAINWNEIEVKLPDNPYQQVF